MFNRFQSQSVGLFGVNQEASSPVNYPMPSDQPEQAIPPSEPGQAGTSDRLSVELLDHAYYQLSPALAANFCLSLLVVLVLWSLIPSPLLITWLISIWLLSLLRLIVKFYYHRADSQTVPGKWRILFIAGLQLSALAWGIGGILLFTESSTAHQVFLAFVLGGLVAGATTSLAALQNQLRLFVMFLVLPISMKFFLIGNGISLAMGLMVLLYGLTSAVMSGKVHRILLSALTLRLENLAEIESRRKAESSLNQYKNNLERLIIERTRALTDSNEELFREIIERKKAEEEKDRLLNKMIHIQKMEAIGTLAGGIAHDFNNILSIIIGFTELAEDECSGDGHLRSDLREISKAAHRGKNTVRQILQFSSNEQVDPIIINPKELLLDINNLLRATIPSTVIFKSELSSDCGPILADPNQIQRLLANLATNAVQAMEEKGVLTFSLEQVRLGPDDLKLHSNLSPGYFVKISVSDTGCGIKPELRERIFEPFDTTKEIDKGTGMGLAVVHGIVSSNQGLITVDSAPGQGSTFNVFFPVATRVKETSPRPLQDTPTGNERILVVDDDLAITELTSRLLSGQGYQVTTCTGGSMALEQLRSSPSSFDLVITDQSMPDLSGIELAEELLKIRPELPVILCTGYSSKISPEIIQCTGIKDVLMKPMERQKLASRVRAVLDLQGSSTAN